MRFRVWPFTTTRHRSVSIFLFIPNFARTQIQCVIYRTGVNGYRSQFGEFCDVLIICSEFIPFLLAVSGASRRVRLLCKDS